MKIYGIRYSQYNTGLRMRYENFETTDYRKAQKEARELRWAGHTEVVIFQICK